MGFVQHVDSCGVRVWCSFPGVLLGAGATQTGDLEVSASPPRRTPNPLRKLRWFGVLRGGEEVCVVVWWGREKEQRGERERSGSMTPGRASLSLPPFETPHSLSSRPGASVAAVADATEACEPWRARPGVGVSGRVAAPLGMPVSMSGCAAGPRDRVMDAGGLCGVWSCVARRREGLPVTAGGHLYHRSQGVWPTGTLRCAERPVYTAFGPHVPYDDYAKSGRKTVMSPGVTVLLAVSVALNVIMMYREVNRAVWKRRRKQRGRGRSPYRPQQRQRQRRPRQRQQ